MDTAQLRLRSPLLVPFVAALLVALACAGCAPASGPGTVHVVSFSPEISAGPDSPIQITFSGPVVPVAMVGAELKTPPVRLEPAAPLAARWVDRQTLVLRPLSPLKRATRYRIVAGEALGARLSEGDTPPSFVVAPLELVAVRGVDASWAGPRDTYELVLSEPVSAAAAAEKCALLGPAPLGGSTSGTARVAFEAAPLDAGVSLEPGHVLLRPRTDLRRGETYRLVCDGLTAASGGEPLVLRRPHEFAVRPPFALAIAPVGQGGVISPDRAEISIRASQPLHCGDLRERVAFEPAVPSDAVYWRRVWNTGGKEIVCQAEVEFQANRAYRMTVSAGAESAFGDVAPAPPKVEFRTGPPTPRVFLEPGMHAIEGETKGYQLWTRNVRSVDLACAAVPRARLVGALDGGLPLWAERGQDGVITPLDWKALRLTPRRVTLDTSKALDRWTEHRVDFRKVCGPADKGAVYLAEFRAPDAEPHLRPYERYPHRVLANPTDLAVVVKAGASGGAVWVTRFSTGAPVEGATVTLRDPKGKVVFTGATDRDGLARTPGTGTRLAEAARVRQRRAERGQEDEYEDEYEGDWNAQRWIVTAELGADMALVDGQWNDGLSAWNFGHSRDLGRGETELRAFIQSDRGLYRPGERVSFQGWLRDIGPGGEPKVPAERVVRVSVENARGERVHEDKLELSPFGGFTFDHTLAEGAPLGDYLVRVQARGETFTERFSVEEFRPLAFDLGVQAGNVRRTKAAVELPLTVSAAYLFGAPLRDAPLTWSTSHASVWFRPPGLEEFSVSDYASGGSTYEWYGDGDDGSGGRSFLADGEGKTDAKGLFALTATLPRAEVKGPTQIRAEVSVTDPSGQVVTRRHAEVVHAADFYFGVKSEGWVGRVGSPFGVTLRAARPDGTPVRTAGELIVGTRRWVCARGSSCKVETKEVSRRKVTFDEKGAFAAQVSFPSPGEHFIQVRGKDAGGRVVAASDYVWVIGKGRSHWADSEEIRMDLVASKDEYRVGDTAVLVPRAEVSEQYALVTLERTGVMHARVERLSGERGVEVAVTDALAPNAYVSVVSVRGRAGPGDAERPRVRMGVAALKVSTAEKRLEVKVKTDRPRYEPGDEVVGEILVTRGGKPVRAEVAVSVADEGVLRLIDYRTPDPMARFYAAWGLGVETSTNHVKLFRDQEPRGFTGDEGSDASAPETRVRSKFVSSAFFAPALVTDEAGRVTFRFRAPDNLTAFRAMAAAATEAGSFGASERSFEVQRALMATPILPRFFEEGDAIEIGATLHNHTEADTDVRVRLEAAGLTLSERERRVRVPKGGTARAVFEARVPVGGEQARVALSAASATHQDAFELTLPVYAPVVIEHRILAALAAPGAGQTSAVGPVLALPEGAEAKDASLEILVDTTGLAAVAPGLEYLVEYPYGCLEQTLSRTVPLLKARELGEALDLKSLKKTKLEAFVRAGLRKVLEFQRDDGHFALWKDAPSQPELTAYALWGLSEARLAGVRVPEANVSRGLDALSAWANHADRRVARGGELATLAMAAYVLAESGRGDAALETRLFEGRGALPTYGQAFLLRALVASKAPADRVATLVRELESRVTVTAGRAFAHEQEDLRAYMSSDVRTTAILLSALLRADRSHALIPQLKAGLLFARDWGGAWPSTQDNAYALIAFSDLARLEAAGSAKAFALRAGDRVVWKVPAATKGKGVMKKTVPLGPLLGSAPSAELPAGATVVMRARYPRRVAAAEANRLRIQREYLQVDKDEPVGPLRVGDLVRVRLTASTERTEFYLALRDAIPSGFEAVNARFQTSASAASSVDGRNEPSWWDDWDRHWVHRELRDEAALAFANRAEGTMRYEYVLRASHAGTFLAAPASVEAMYEPDRFARTDATTLKVLP